MPNPKRRHTRARRDKRRASNWKIKLPSISKCPNCGGLNPSHQICRHCGSYKGKIEKPMKEKKTEKTDKTEKKEKKDKKESK